MGKVFAFANGLHLGDLSGHMIDDDLEEFSFLCGIDGKLEFAVFDLKFSGDRLSFRLAGNTALLQAYLCSTQCIRQFRMFLVGTNRKSQLVADGSLESDKDETKGGCKQHFSSRWVTPHIGRNAPCPSPKLSFHHHPCRLQQRVSPQELRAGSQFRSLI